MTALAHSSSAAARLAEIDTFDALVAYLRDELDWEIPEGLSYEKLTYSYTADELGLKLDAQVEITQLRPILGQKDPWGVFFVDFDKAELPVTLLRRILSRVSRNKRSSADPGDRALFDKDDLLFVSAFGKAEERRLALAHFHQEPETTALPTLRVVTWDRQDTARHMQTVAERLALLRWPDRGELPETWKARWSRAFVDRPRDAIRTSKDMAAALAACAKQIREAIQEILPKERPGQPLSQLFDAVKATLNKDLDVPKFADTYAQTIAYGLLSKRIDQVQRWRAEKARSLDGSLPLPSITVDALETAIPTNPFLSELLNSFLAAGGRDRAGAGLDFDELGLGDVIDLLNTANMEAVLDDFDKDKQGDDPVIHFYEGFLAAYDKAMKVQRGVFYTPKPVVSFIVRSMDEVLRSEFGLPLGLADTTTWGEFVAAHPDTKIPDGVMPDEPFVKILDPATGTGTFLVEVIDLIWRRMTEEAWKGRPAEEKGRLWNVYVAEHLLPRLYGYELMMAPYAVAHMKIGLKLADTGYQFSGKERGPDGRMRPTRARVFLTNALEPAQDLDAQLEFMNEALAHEAKAANDAKKARFIGVVGNPPYAVSSNNKGSWITELLRPYKDGLGEQNIQPLSDDYIKFIRLSSRLVEDTGLGVVALITNNSYLDGIIHRAMRQSLIAIFGRIDVVNLHGNANIGEKCPDGSKDENVFDIKQGVSIVVMRRTTNALSDRIAKYADAWGLRAEKFSLLSSRQISTTAKDALTPSAGRYLFIPDNSNGGGEYQNFPSLNDVMPLNGMGIKFRKERLLVSDHFTRASVLQMANDVSLLSVAQLSEKYGLSETPDWKVEDQRRNFAYANDEEVYEVQFRPFDYRYALFPLERISKIIPRGDARVPVMRHMLRDNLALTSTRQTRDEWDIRVSSTLVTHKSLSAYDVTSVFPLWRIGGGTDTLTRANLAPQFTKSLAKLAGLRFQDESDGRAHGALPGADSPSPQGSTALRRERGDLKTTFGARDVFDWIYAALHSPAYRERYADFLKSDFARVPLPKDRDLFAELIPLGTKLVALHLLDADALPDLLNDPKVRFVSNGGEPRLGRFNKEVRRDVSGRVYLNDQNWFATVHQATWEHWTGGYQPAQKWLKDRSQTGSNDKLKPGRLLTDEDIVHYRRMIVALEETGKVMTEIDEVIARHGGWPEAFKGMADD